MKIIMIVIVWVLLSVQWANADVVLDATRIIFPSDKDHSALQVMNTKTSPYLIQAWVTQADGQSAKSNFVVTPPLFKLESGKTREMRILKLNNKLPQDRESLYYVSVKGIPPINQKDGILQIALKTTIKMIYRPKSLTGTPEEAARKLIWSSTPGALEVSNPSPFYLSFFSLKLADSELANHLMIPPFSKIKIGINDKKSTGALKWAIINDFGGVSDIFTSILPNGSNIQQ
jgi:P pilus assembly chaperone PapD